MYHCEELTIGNENDFLKISAYRNLWEISFAFCQSLPKDIDALLEFACLGFVDFSFTSINLKQLQTTIAKMNIIHLNIVGCPRIVESEADYLEKRGFLIQILPSAWILNEIYISFNERQYWRHFFSTELSTLWAKWKMETNTFFTAQKPSIWTERAKEWLSYPNCQMGADLDAWKLKKIEKHLRIETTVIGGSNSVVLVLLLLASFFPCYPKFILYDVMKRFSNYTWPSFELSPLNLSRKHRTLYLGILFAKRELKISASSIYDADWIFCILPKLLYYFQKCAYPLESKRNHNDVLTGYKCEKFDNPMFVLDSSFNEKITKLHLSILELLCTSTHERLFLTHANTFRKMVLAMNNIAVEFDLDNDWEYIPEGMSMASRAVEVKLKLYLLLTFAQPKSQK